MEKPYYLAGEWRRDGESLRVQSPFTGEEVGSTFRPPTTSVDTAVDRAVAAAREFGRTPVFRRAEILTRIAGGIEEAGDDLALMIAQEAGKPVRYAKGEVARAVRTFSEAAEECSRLYGEILPLDVTAAAVGRRGITTFVPLGPVLAITPFNFPLNLVAHKLAPAIAAGCPVILKPSSETPLTALMLAEIIDRVGLPAGALSVLPLAGSVCGELAGRSEIRKVTFTGSAEVGWELKRRAWDKRATLELGGNAAVILHDDWEEIGRAAGRIATGGYAYAGQVCISVQRIYAQRGVYETFKERFLEQVRSLGVGDPLSEETDVGPMITSAEAERVESWLREAERAGVTLLTGGAREGSMLEPVVVEGARPGMKIVDDEVFGPVTCLFPYGGFDEALAAVNDSRFGLQAGVYTNDLQLAFRAFDELEVGGVVIGDVPTFRVDRMPYGGVKRSGFGREGLRYSIREMCELRLMVLSA